MSNSRSDSRRSSQTSSPVPIQLTKSIVVSKVSPEYTEEELFNDFCKQSSDVVHVTRFYYDDGAPNTQVRVDFRSIEAVKKIMEKNFFLVKGKQHPVRVYHPPICYRCHDEGHRSHECPEQPISETRLQQLLHEHQQNMQQMITTFETKWNARLQNLSQPKTAVPNDQVAAICHDLAQLCQGLQQQTAQMQTPLINVQNRLRALQQQNSTTVVQNGH